MKERSGMPYDVVAYEADELARMLSPEEEGIFHRMLRLAWMNGSIPANLDALAELCRVRPSTMKKAWVRLQKLWYPMKSDPTRLENKKQKSERFFLKTKREQASAAGKLSAKLQKERKEALTTVERTLNERSTSQPSPSQPVPDPSPSTINNSNTETNSPSTHSPPAKKRGSAVSVYPDDFETFWNTYPKRKGKGAAFTAWKKNGHPGIDRLVEVLELAKRTQDWLKDAGQYIPNPATWLNQKRWDDEYVTVDDEREKAEKRAAEIYGDKLR